MMVEGETAAAAVEEEEEAEEKAVEVDESRVTYTVGLWVADLSVSYGTLMEGSKTSGRHR